MDNKLYAQSNYIHSRTQYRTKLNIYLYVKNQKNNINIGRPRAHTIGGGHSNSSDSAETSYKSGLTRAKQYVTKERNRAARRVTAAAVQSRKNKETSIIVARFILIIYIRARASGFFRREKST